MNTTKLYNVLTENQAFIREDVYQVLIGMVNEEIAKESERSAGRKPVIRNAVKNFLSDGTHYNLQFAQVQELDGKKYYGYCDGFKLCWSTIDFGFGISDNPLNWKEIINCKYKNPGKVAINKADLIAHIKTKKDDRRRGKLLPYRIEYGNGLYIDLNPKFLKSAIDFTGASEVVVDFGRDDGNFPIQLHNEEEDRHALVLPIRRR